MAMAGLTWVDSGQAVMTEHVALVPLTASLAILTLQSTVHKPGHRRWYGFAWGVLAGLASLIRSNLAIPVVLVFLCMALQPRLRFLSPRRKSTLSMPWAALGLFSVLGLTTLPYLMTGNLVALWHGAIMAPLRYTQNKQIASVAESVVKAAFSLLNGSSRELVTILLPLGCLLIVVPALWLAVRRRIADRNTVNILFWTSTYLFGVGSSVLRGGAFHKHYALQWMPFSAIILAVGLSLVLKKAESIDWRILRVAWSALVISLFFPCSRQARHSPRE
jgi:4-amino-4-deoxy-L-arabinose transferase-like glycosyltransferase